MEGIHHKNTGFPEPENMIALRTSFYTTSEAAPSDTLTQKNAEPSSLKALDLPAPNYVQSFPVLQSAN